MVEKTHLSLNGIDATSVLGDDARFPLNVS